MFAEVVKRSDVKGHLESGFWEAIFDHFEEHGHGRVRGGSGLDLTTDVASRVDIRDSCSRVSELFMSWLASDCAVL